MGPHALLGLARLSSALKGKEGKLPDYYRQLANPGSGVETWLEAARSALASGEPERCKGILEALLEREPGNITASLLLSHTCQQLGSSEALDESVAVARSALSQASVSEDSRRAAVQLAVSLGSRARLHTQQQVDRQKDRAEAIQLLTEPTSPAAAAAAAATSPTPSPAAHALYCLALLQAEAGQAAAALTGAREALAAAQAGGEAGLTSLCLALLANLLSSRGQHKLALSVLSAAPTSSSPSVPASPSGAVHGAGAHSQSGAAGAALTSTSSSSNGAAALWGEVLVCRLRSRLLGAQCEAAGSLEALAGCKKRLAGWAEGRSQLPAGVTRAAAAEALVQVWCELAVALAATGQRPEALAAADHALAAAPWAAVTRAALGAVHEALEEYDEAAAAYDMALALDPTHAPSLLRRASLHARLGGAPGLALARDLLVEALRYEPASAPAWHALGSVAAAQQHRADAEAHLLTAVQLAAAEPALPYAELPLESGL